MNTFCILHCIDTYLRTTENWLFKILKHHACTEKLIASDRFLECNFELPDADFLRFPMQPILHEDTGVTAWLRAKRIAVRMIYPWYLLVALRGKQVDVIHSHFAQVGWRFRKLARQLDAVHVVSFYGWDYVRLAAGSPMWQSRLTKLYESADGFICEGPHGASLLIRNGCPTSKIHIARLGVEPEQIPFFQRAKRPGTLRLVQVASFKEKKGHLDTVNAFATALRERIDMHLTLVGVSPGEVSDQVIDAIRKQGISDNVTLLPGVGFDELYTTMRDFQVFIHPSRHARNGDCEGGAPVVLLDAQATGMPVISTNHCDIPEEVVDGVTGTLCAERNIQALADAIIRFCDMDHIEYSRFAHAARMHVMKHFDAKDCAQTVESIYRDLLTDHREEPR